MATIRDDLSTGLRVYIQTRFGEPFVDEIKKVGGHWDGEKKMWWISPRKRKALEEALVEADRELDRRKDAGEPEVKPQDPDDIRLTGKGRYKGKVYYAGAVSKDGRRVRLLTLPDADGKYLDFWADCAEVEQVKKYERRYVWDGVRYSGRKVEKYTTLGSIADFIRRQKDPDRVKRVQCMECDAWHDEGEPCHECGGC